MCMSGTYLPLKNIHSKKGKKISVLLCDVSLCQCTQAKVSLASLALGIKGLASLINLLVRSGNDRAGVCVSECNFSTLRLSAL